MRIIYSPAARRDLNDINLYTEREWGRQQQLRYLTKVRDTIRLLATMPTMGRSHPVELFGLRSYPIGSHIVYYKQEGQSLYILRLLH